MTTRGPAIGLFGGSFNPAHAGHRHVAEAGLRELGLDQVWWLVSPQNPLKPAQPSAYDRAKTIEALRLPYAMKIKHLESDLGTRYTIDLIEALQDRHPAVRFVFIMGADNLLQLPRWRRWTDIVSQIPIAVIARPGSTIRSRLSPAARRLAPYRIPENQAHTLKDQAAPAWTYLTLPLNPLSSSALRAAEISPDIT
jgi:nicotinate-nucleotide adenylyltransferase